jgi:AraC family transcriptional regulator, activator of mtrCDE
LVRSSTFTRSFPTLLSEQGILGDFFWKMAYTNYCNRVLFFAAAPDDRMKQTVLRLYEQAQLETKKAIWYRKAMSVFCSVREFADTVRI